MDTCSTPNCSHPPHHYFSNAKGRMQRNKKCRHCLRYKTKFGITYPDVLSMIEDQHGECPGCGKDLIENKACVDHDHDTGEVRGVLCANCNKAIGQAQENVEVLKNLVKYLEN